MIYSKCDWIEYSTHKEEGAIINKTKTRSNSEIGKRHTVDSGTQIDWMFSDGKKYTRQTSIKNGCRR